MAIVRGSVLLCGNDLRGDQNVFCSEIRCGIATNFGGGRGPARPPILRGELGDGHHAFSMPLCSEPSRSRRCAPTPLRGASDLDGPCAQRVSWQLRDGRLNTPTLRRVTRDRPRSHSGLLQQDRRAHIRGLERLTGPETGTDQDQHRRGLLRHDAGRCDSAGTGSLDSG